jgi:hypothetical protein
MKTKNGHDGRIDPIQALRRLGDALAGPAPDEAESRRLCAELGIDVDAMYARVMEKVREGLDAEQGPPVSGQRRVDPARGAPIAREAPPAVVRRSSRTAGRSAGVGAGEEAGERAAARAGRGGRRRRG